MASIKGVEAKLIKLEHVNKYFGANHVLKDINLEVAEGEKVVIIGPSGSGKSTTVRCMNFLEEPTDGKVFIDGTEVTPKNKLDIVRHSSAMVFQQFNLYPHMTVLGNLTIGPMKLQGKTKKEAEEMAYEYRRIARKGERLSFNTLRRTTTKSSNRKSTLFTAKDHSF